MPNEITIVLSLPEQQQLAEIIEIQRQLSKATGSEQSVTLIFRNGHMTFINATNNRKAAHPHAIMDEQYSWRDQP